MWRANSLERILMPGKIEGRRRRGWQRVRWLDGISDTTDMLFTVQSLSRVQLFPTPNRYEFEQTLGDSEGQQSLACCNPWGCKESDTTKWTTKTTWIPCLVPTQHVMEHAASRCWFVHNIHYFHTKRSSLFFVFFQITVCLVKTLYFWASFEARHKNVSQFISSEK